MSVATITSGRLLWNSLQPFSPVALRHSKVHLLEALIDAECSCSPFARQHGLELSLSPRLGQTLPACYFASPEKPATGPFGCCTSCPGITPGQVTFHRTLRYGARTTRYLRFGSPVFASSLTSTPLQGFSPLRLHPCGRHRLATAHARNQVPCEEAYRKESPDLPSLPTARIRVFAQGCGSSFRVRYFSFGSLFRLPLEPFRELRPLGR